MCGQVRIGRTAVVHVPAVHHGGRVRAAPQAGADRRGAGPDVGPADDAAAAALRVAHPGLGRHPDARLPQLHSAHARLLRRAEHPLQQARSHRHVIRPLAVIRKPKKPNRCIFFIAARPLISDDTQPPFFLNRKETPCCSRPRPPPLPSTKFTSSVDSPPFVFGCSAMLHIDIQRNTVKRN